MVTAKQHRIEIQRTVLIVQNRYGEWRFVIAVDDFSDQIGALVAIEQRAQYLNLIVRI